MPLKTSYKSQGAMEYLTTYSWAILIIAVTLISLSYFGLLGTNHQQRVASNGCMVFRPYGPNTTQGITLQGLCNTEDPKFVAQFPTPTGSVSSNGFMKINNQNIGLTAGFTITAWVYRTRYSGWRAPAPPQAQTMGIFNYKSVGIGTNYGWDFQITGTNGLQVVIGSPLQQPPNFGVFSVSANTAANTIQTLSTWYFVAASFAPAYSGCSGYCNGYINISINGKQQVTNSVGTTYLLVATISNSVIGAIDANVPSVNSWQGEMSNVQLYNEALSANDINSLYREGIGAPPINLKSLVAWWPLNGNGADNSGNGFNANYSNVAYNSTWGQGYSGT